MRRPTPDELARGSVALFFVGAGALHFVKTGAYERIMPPFVPYAREAVLVSGVAEIAGGAAVPVPRLRRIARWWLIVLLLAVFPANVYMAMAPEEIPGLEIPGWLLWARLPVQGLFIAWVVRGTR